MFSTSSGYNFILQISIFRSLQLLLMARLTAIAELVKLNQLAIALFKLYLAIYKN